MTVSTRSNRLARILTLTLAVAAFVVPAAQANGGLVDDWFRDAPSSAQRTPPFAYGVADRLVDDYFRDPRPPTSDGQLVDDWFRDSTRVPVAAQSAAGFDWADFGVGAAAMLGIVLLAAALGVGVLAHRRSGELRST